MHWKGLRLGTLHDSEPSRLNLAEPQFRSRHSEQLPRPTVSTSNLAPRHSESSPRSPTLTGLDDNNEHDNQGAGSNSTARNLEPPAAQARSAGALQSSGDNSSWRRSRFSFMKLRHASDPQLSKTYARGENKDSPPVPNLPPPPTIITTAPTSHELDQPVKRKGKLGIFPEFQKPPVVEPPSKKSTPNGMSRQVGQGSTDSQAADPLSASRISSEEPGRLSTTSIRSTGRERPNASHRSSAADVRFSESSRSDQSLGDSAISRTHSPNGGSSSSSKRFRMPRLKRNRGPLFPLPPKPTTRTLELSRSGSAPHDSTPRSNLSGGQDHISPLPSPSRSSAGLSSSRPPLLRKDSSHSAHSSHSTPSIRNRGTHRTRPRSSTLDSVANVHDSDPQPSSHLPSSGRTSISTTGRKSFGDIFSITQRLRQNSEPAFLRNGSPSGTKGASTPLSKLQSYPEREEGDTHATYLTRLEESIPKSTIAGVLSQSGEDFYKNTLRKYMRGFSFFGDPIDMAIRKLLMEVELPKETQQIDRFLQSFADRYHECNPGIFASTDQAYFIAFSILILHTDVFNKNNKRKMQKPDYVKNTRGEGVSEDILECFYENISYTPFIRIEDSNASGRLLAKPRRTLFRVPSSDHLARAAREPVDPYTLIMDGKLDTLRPSLREVMNLDDTYSCNPTTGPPDVDTLHRAFIQSCILQIVSARSRPDAFMPSSIDNPADSNPGLVDIKVAKVGLLWRKDPKKKRARSPWQEWGALLTLSQLYFFKDVNWVKSLMSQGEAHRRDGRRRPVTFKPPLLEFNPDGIMSTDHAVALLDSNYKKHKHAFIFVRPNSLEEVFLANSEADMNDWLAKLNYAAAFRTTGVGSKGMTVTNYDAQRNRMSRRGSSTSNISSSSADKDSIAPSSDLGITEEVMTARKQLIQQKIREANETLFINQKQLDELLRNARHLQVLTPVHSRAREQLIMGAGRMAAKLKWVRQDIWRTKCHREVLVRDLGEDEDKVEVLGEPQNLRLQIPAPSIASKGGVTGESHSDKPVSPMTDVSPGMGPGEPSAVNPIPSPPHSSADVLRRPSLAASVTSPDLFARAGRKSSVDTAKDRTKSASPRPTHRLEREASVLSAASRIDVSSLGSRASKLTLPGSFDDSEERILREAGLLDTGSSSPSRKGSTAVEGADGEQKQEGAPEGSQGDQMSRVRRSFHRTLRDSTSGNYGNYPRSKKSRDSASSAPAEDNQSTVEGGGLSRKTGSFTVHGKKASIVTFGSEWQNIPPEERLKLRKPTPSEEPRAAELATLGSGDSICSGPRTSSEVPRRLSRDEIPDDGVELRSTLSESAVSAMSQVGGITESFNIGPEDQLPSALVNDGAVDETRASALPPSPPEQAVNA